ncbi:transposase [Streptomyces rochei]|uniref:transposase n=2 Tax=Streptomyces rochei TaxID=1928 RepID=UPI0036BA9D1F
MDRRLYLPEHFWSGDPERRTAAGIPERVRFATKPRRASEMIASALDAGITASWVTGDEAHGQDPRLRAAPETRGTGYVMAVACSMRVRINHGRTPIRTDTLAGRPPGTAWQRYSAGNGARRVSDALRDRPGTGLDPYTADLLTNAATAVLDAVSSQWARQTGTRTAQPCWTRGSIRSTLFPASGRCDPPPRHQRPAFPTLRGRQDARRAHRSSVSGRMRPLVVTEAGRRLPVRRQ